MLLCIKSFFFLKKKKTSLKVILVLIWQRSCQFDLLLIFLFCWSASIWWHNRLMGKVSFADGFWWLWWVNWQLRRAECFCQLPVLWCFVVEAERRAINPSPPSVLGLWRVGLGPRNKSQTEHWVALPPWQGDFFIGELMARMNLCEVGGRRSDQE